VIVGGTYAKVDVRACLLEEDEKKSTAVSAAESQYTSYMMLEYYLGVLCTVSVSHEAIEVVYLQANARSNIFETHRVSCLRRVSRGR
jgi:hypothetical protein